ncbi:MAG: hypothetical protein OEM67_12575, partial [Thermoleophilia bacterium]|nr:hypothetical protein [Thermoleophilia bacterium]
MSLFVSRRARRALQLEPGSAERLGGVPMKSFADARHLALKLNAAAAAPATASAGELVALAALDDFYRTFLMRYLRLRDPRLVR